MYGRFPAARPPGLRRRALGRGTILWRIDAQPPRAWDWEGFPEPRNRFDPVSGRYRVRYAALSLAGAFRERYNPTGRYIPADHRTHHIVRLETRRALRLLDLRTEANLDALRVDDRISTGREKEVLDAAHRLVDACQGWWPDLDGLAYRSRTTPETSMNLAFFSLEPFATESAPLDDSHTELAELVLEDGFTVGWPL